MTAIKIGKNLIVIMLIAALVLGSFVVLAGNLGGVRDTIDTYINPPKSGSILTVYYEDSDITPTRYDSKDYSSDGKPLAIYSSLAPQPDSPVKKVKIEVYMTASWETDSSLSSYTVSGDYTVVLTRVAPSATLKTFNVPMSPLHPTLTNGQSAVIASAELSASQIEQLISGNGGQKGTSYIYVITYKLPQVTLDMTFANGDTDSETAAAPDTAFSCIWRDATGTSSITGLSVSFYRSIYQ